VRRSLLKWRESRKERKRLRYLERYGDVDRGELQNVLEQQSPVRGKWGFFPK
jgi:hypothetical protein